ncbi:MAG: 6-phosphogluconolactonase [Bifidobacteriaceae bacterium]|jgi:6-phosphogluconolactonase|nr:6-phosphogluconolactonase [Bifidobacteriaceae bacterium]
MRTVLVLPDRAAVAEAAAQRLVAFLLETQSLASPVHLALTGGGLGIAVLEHVRRNPLLGSVCWADVHFWWGDERFTAAGSPERNDLAADRALLDHLPVRPGGIHRVGAADQGLSLVEAATRYSDELRRQAVVFSLVLLGVGPDGHVASIFPGGGDGSDTKAPAAFAVPDSPKPPPARVSLTLDTINAADQVWLFAAGASKRAAVTAALAAPAVPSTLPAARAAGRRQTLWLIDAPAA